MKHVVCYSGGHSSAIAAIECARRYGKENVVLLNHDINPRVEDPDIKRFKKEVADYIGIQITHADMPGWEQKDQFDICMEIVAFKYGIQSSALCTQELKTKPFHEWLAQNYPSTPSLIRDDIEVIYGFDATEPQRITRRVGKMAAMGYKTDYPMLWDQRTIHDTEEIGICRPSTYGIFNHANCRGCLKAGKQHWYIVYCLYPEIWDKAKAAEAAIGYSILRGNTLEELQPEFELLKKKMLPATEKIKSQKFWATARKYISEEDVLPCECSF